MKQRMTIFEFMDTLLPAWFGKRLLRRDSWSAWRVFLAAVFGLPLTAEELVIYTKHTGRTTARVEGHDEIFVIAGRGAGKSLVSALIAVYLAAVKTYFLVPGEVGVGMVLASDRQQAGVCLSYIQSFFTRVPILAKMVLSETRDSITIKNGASAIRIEVHTADYKSVRGFSAIFCIADEVAFWSTNSDAANPDVEVLAAIKPALARVPGSKLLVISSPYSEEGVLFDTFRAHYGRNESETLVWRGTTRQLNPTFPEKTIRRALEEDAARASAEYLAEFRPDLAGFLERRKVEACVAEGIYERAPVAGGAYLGFCDASGGVRDSFTMAIAHFDSAASRAVLDVVREVEAPFSPSAAIAQLVPDLRRFGICEIVGDRYAGEFPRDEFRSLGVEYKLAELDRSQLYLELLPTINSGRCELLDNRRLVNQLCALRRRTGVSGRDRVDHPPNGHDDVANCVAGVLLLARGDSLVLGVLDYFSSGLAQQHLNALQNPARISPVKDRGVQLVAPLGERGEHTISGCSHCGAPSSLQSVIAGGQIRCAMCGIQTWPGGVAPLVYRGPSRRGI